MKNKLGARPIRCALGVVFLVGLASGGDSIIAVTLLPPAAAQHADHTAESREDPASSDVAYRTQLGLMRGHLLVGMALYDRSAFQEAKAHMKHPSDELYAGLVPAFTARGVSGFAPELDRLATLVEQDAPENQIQMAYEDLLRAIDAAESGAAGDSAAERLRVIAWLVRIAGDEYAEGVVRGRVVDAHEYQDAYGFVQVARVLAEQALGRGGAAADQAFSRALRALARLDAAWPDLPEPRRALGTDASLLYEAAATIERLASGIE